MAHQEVGAFTGYVAKLEGLYRSLKYTFLSPLAMQRIETFSPEELIQLMPRILANISSLSKIE